MKIILTKDYFRYNCNCFIKDAIKIALLNKEYNVLWKHIKYEHVVKCQDLDVIKRNKNIKFSYKSKKLFDIPKFQKIYLMHNILIYQVLMLKILVYLIYLIQK